MIQLIPKNDHHGVYHKNEFYSYRYIDEISDKVAIHIKSTLGERRNIGIYISNSVDYVVAYFGILKSNNIVVPIYRKVTTYYELNKEINLCDLSAVVFNSESSNDFDSFVFKKGLCTKIDIINNLDLKLCVLSDSSISEVNNENVSFLFQSSGSTNNPKKIMHSFENIITNMKLHVEAASLNHSEKTLIQLPMTFGYCNTAQMLAHIYLCADIYIGKTFSPNDFIKQIKEYNITNTILVPTQLVALSCYTNISELNHCSLKKVFYGGSHLSSDALLKLIEACPEVEFINTYGQTEAGPRITINLCNKIDGKLFSAGVPLRGIKLEIRNAYVNELGQKMGDIYVNTPSSMLGYYKNEKLTEQTIQNGWINTGDIGYIDEDGYLYITGRKKNIIIVGGINVYPEEIEDVILGYPNVEQVRVFGEDNPLLGEIICAQIECVEGTQLSSLDILRYCSERLSPHKIPFKIYFSHIEKTLNGKIKR